MPISMIGYAYLKIFAAATIEISKASLYFFEFVVVLMLPDFPSYALLTIIFSFFMEEKKSLISFSFVMSKLAISHE